MREASRNIVAEKVKAERANANVVALRHGDSIVFGMRTGLLGHPTSTVLRIPDETIVGAVEDPQELGAIVTQVGMLVVASLFNYNLAWGTEGLAKAMAVWAGIDIEALRKAAEEEAASVTEEVDEDGDVIVRSVEESEGHYLPDGTDPCDLAETDLPAEDPLLDLGGES